MQEDAFKWNARYKSGMMPTESSAFLRDSYSFFSPYLSQNKTRLKAIDLACGNGRNAKLLAQWGYQVDAIDISEVALSNLKGIAHIQPILADLDSYTLPKAHYDFLINSFFLDRRIFKMIKDSLKPQAFVLFETFINLRSSTTLPNDRILAPDELTDIFSPQEGFSTMHQSAYVTTRHNQAQEYVVRFLTQFIPKQDSITQ